MRILFLVILLSTAVEFSVCQASENAPQNQLNSADAQYLSSKELLSQAKSLKRKDPQASLQLANKALALSEHNKNNNIRAQVHTLLGKLAKQAQNSEQASFHFEQVPLIYKSMNDIRKQIIYSVDYIDFLLDEKRYPQADEVIDTLFPIALQYKEKWPLGYIFFANGHRYYQQKKYQDAIGQYKQAVKYLSSEDYKIKKKLGDTYKQIAQSYKRLENRKETIVFYKKALDIFTVLDDSKNIARTLNTLATSERYMGHLQHALDYSMNSLEVHKTIDDPEGSAKASTEAGIIFRHIGSYDKSVEHIYHAHLYYKKINYASGIAETSNQLGFIYTRLKEFEEAKAFYQIVIDLKDKISQNILASALREMSVIYLDAGNYDLALTMAEKTLKIYQEADDALKQSLITRIIANIYHDQKNNEKAALYYKESLRFAVESGNTVYQIKAQSSLAVLLIASNTQAAINELKQALILSIRSNDKGQMLYIYKNLRKAEKLLGNIAESLSYSEQEIKLTEIIQKEKDDRRLILLRAKLYSHTKEMELVSLREKAQLVQLELIKKNTEIEIAEKTRTINELKLIKNQYANFTLALLLTISILLVVFIYRLFVASKKRNKELDYLAARDPLTHCYNRRALFEYMYQDFEKSDSLDDYCIIMVDIDHFKDVNDTYGHSAGDSVICGVADILQANISENDMVARLGGEEFCIYLHRATETEALEIAEAMRHQVEIARFDDISITCSCGVSSIKYNAKTYLELINQADLALYQSKSLGRNQVTMWKKEFGKDH